MNLKESIRKILREETLDEGGMMDSLKKFFGKKEKTPEDRLINVIAELIKQNYTIDQKINDDRLLEDDSELMGKVFEKLFKKKVNKSYGYSRL